MLFASTPQDNATTHPDPLDRRYGTRPLRYRQRAPLGGATTLNRVWQLSSPLFKALRTDKGEAPPLLAAAKALYQARSAQLARGDGSFRSDQQVQAHG